MAPALSNYKLAAFIMAFKAARRNSVWHSWDKAHHHCETLGISQSTFRKYMQACRKEGLLIDIGGSRHCRFVSLKVALPALIDSDMRGIARLFDNEIWHTVKDYYDKILFAVAEKNFKKQQYRINQKKVLDRLSTSRYLRKGDKDRLCKMQKQVGSLSLTELPCIVERNKSIITGKNHLGKVIGCSPASASLLLKKWHNAGKIVRSIVRRFFNYCNHQLFDQLKKEGYKYIGASRDNTCMIVCLGSRLCLR